MFSVRGEHIQPHVINYRKHLFSEDSFKKGGNVVSDTFQTTNQMVRSPPPWQPGKVVLCVCLSRNELITVRNYTNKHRKAHLHEQTDQTLYAVVECWTFTRVRAATLMLAMQSILMCVRVLFFLLAWIWSIPQHPANATLIHI